MRMPASRKESRHRRTFRERDGGLMLIEARRVEERPRSDPGARDLVMPLSACTEVAMWDSEKQQKRLEYEVAKGRRCPLKGSVTAS